MSPPSPRQSLSRASVAFQLVVLTIIWGVNWPIMKMGVTDLPPMTFRFVTLLGGVITFLVAARYQGVSLAIERQYWPEAVQLGLTNAIIWYVLSIYGVQLLASGRAAILGYTLPVWVAIIGTLMFGERHGKRLLAGVAFAAIGIALLLANEFSAISGRPLGAACMVGGAAIWAYGTHRMRRRRLPASLTALTFWILVGGALVCGVLALIFESGQRPAWPSGRGWFSIIYNAILVYGVAQVLWFRLATVLTPVVSALSVMLIPVVGVASGVLLLGERLVWTDLAALVAILVSIGITLLPARR